MTLLEADDVPFAPVHNIPDVIDDQQVRHLQTFRTLKHPTEGDIVADPPAGPDRRRPRRQRPAGADIRSAHRGGPQGTGLRAGRDRRA